MTKNNNSNRYPIIIVPGLFGSWGEGILKNNNHLDFGPARDMYIPLLDFLMKNGYRFHENLFISFYNWRLNNNISSKKYLIPMINRAKKIAKKDKVILICHSMGGIVARSYIQGVDYQNDVDTLVMIGTPNSGSSTSYLFWEGGEIPYDNLKDNFLFKIFWNSYLWHLKKTYNNKELKSLHEYFPSIKELLPTKSFYGNYIYESNRYGRKKYIDISSMKHQNYYLNKLNKDINKLKKRVKNIHQVIGYGTLTNDSIYVKKSNNDKWIDGKPINIDKTMSGDGTVTSKSSMLEGINKYYLKSNHSDLVKYSIDILKEALNLPHSIKVTNDEKIYVSILLENIKNLNMKIGKYSMNSKDIYKYNWIDYIPLENDGYWLIIKRKYIERLELDIVPKDSKEVSFLFSSNNTRKNSDNFKELKINKQTNIQLI